MATTAARGGLEGVVSSVSSISSIEDDVLRYRGYSIEDLAAHSTFEEVIYLLWHGELPTPLELASTRAEIAAYYDLPDLLLRFLRRLPVTGGGLHPMAILRSAISLLSIYDPEAEDMTPDGNQRKAMRLTARTGTIVASYGRARSGQEPSSPDGEKGIAENFLTGLRGEPPRAVETAALDTLLIVLADHELNASTFAARVTAATLSDIYSAVTAAVATLKGPLHGGAAQQVMTFLEEAEAAPDLKQWLAVTLASGRRVAGFGHRIYKAGDPRCRILKERLLQLSSDSGDDRWLMICGRLEEAMREQTGLPPNVDFYASPCYEMLGIPRDLFGCVFAVSRVAGWTAHIIEQYTNNRLIRPRAEYVGPAPRDWRPLEERS
jgi:2-methylcitrate synthase